MLIIISLWLITAFLAAIMAKNKKRNPVGWFFIAFFLLGIFSILLLMLLPAKKTQPQLELPLSQSHEPLQPTNDGFEQFAGKINEEKIYRISTLHTLDWYLIDAQGTRQGPLNYEAFRLLIREQEKPKETYVWNTELEDWLQLKKFINIEILFDKDFD